MKSFQTLYEEAQSTIVDDDSATLALLKIWINEGARKCYSVLNAERFYDTVTDLTVASQLSYPLPAKCEKVHTIVTTVDSVDYPAFEWAGTEAQWNMLTDGISSTEGDYPQWFFVKRETFELYPIPSTAGYTLTEKFKIKLVDLAADDFTTESVKTAVVGSTAIVGNTGTTWTSAMAGRYFKVDADGVWYRITSVTDGTNLVLSREYEGTAITAGTSSYTIADCYLLPEDLQEAPLDYTYHKYYLQKENASLAGIYKNSFDSKLGKIEQSSNDTTSGIITDTIEIRNANNYPLNLQ